jgi:hypothetical protein
MPRHREINDFTARKICRDLEIPNAVNLRSRQVSVLACKQGFGAPAPDSLAGAALFGRAYRSTFSLPVNYCQLEFEQRQTGRNDVNKRSEDVGLFVYPVGNLNLKPESLNWPTASENP